MLSSSFFCEVFAMTSTVRRITSTIRPSSVRMNVSSARVSNRVIRHIRVAAPCICFVPWAALRILQAAVPTATPCFRHWRRSLPLLFAFRAPGGFLQKSSLPDPLLRSMYRKNQRFGQESMTTGRYDQRLIFSIAYFSTQYNKKPPVLRIPGASCFTAWGMPYSRSRSP